MPTEQARKESIEAAVGALPEDAETLRIQWRGSILRLKIIRLQLSLALLNPDSHRIKAQLESDDEASGAIKADPHSLESQEAISEVLRSTPGFEALKTDLEDKGQVDPGIVTRTGLLVNANTRAVALRELRVDYIEVAVLPPDATIGEIYALELSLQVAPDFKQEYTFTNELLFVDDLITKENKSEQEVALSLSWAAGSKKGSIEKGIEKVRRYVRHLDLIREVQRISAGKIPLTFFDDALQALLELDRDYQALRDSHPIGANRLKKARILGLLVDLGYDRQRQVDERWVKAHLQDAFEENPLLSGLMAQGLVGEAGTNSTDLGDQFGELEEISDGLNTSSGSAEGDQIFSVVEILVEALSRGAKADQVNLLTSDGERSVGRAELIEAVQDSMRLAADDAKDAAKDGDKLLLPRQRLAQASKNLKKAREAYDSVQDQPGFAKEGFVAEFQLVELALDAIRISLES
jgi:hypothetical protein